jgi:hypothetical protein
LEKRTTQNYLSGQIRGVSRKDIATLGGDVRRTESPLGVLITLEPATKPMMIQEARLRPQANIIIRTWAQTYDSITIVTAQEIGEGLKRLEPMSIEVLKAAQRSLDSEQLSLL